jgi:hypothetical protein
MAKPSEETVQEAAPVDPHTIIIRALNAVMQEVDYVQKTGENDFHKYTYASEADVLDKLRPAMVKHGLVLIPSIAQVSNVDAYGNTTVMMNYTLAHTSGAVWPEKIGAAGCGGDKNRNGVGDKGLYKAITGANKYLLFKLFQIETGDNEPEDPEGDRRRAERMNDDAARKFYVEGGRIAISKAESTTDLKKWWADDADNRVSAGVIKGTDEYSQLHEAFLRKGKELAAKEGK